MSTAARDHQYARVRVSVEACVSVHPLTLPHAHAHAYTHARTRMSHTATVLSRAHAHTHTRARAHVQHCHNGFEGTRTRIHTRSHAHVPHRHSGFEDTRKRIHTRAHAYTHIVQHRHSGFEEAVLRFVGSAFVHASETHLYYNMASFIFKGVTLEQLLGSERYGAMLAILLVLSHGLYILVAQVGSALLGFDGPMRACAVGFSAVIFALKIVLLHHEGQGAQNIWGFRIQNRWVPWAGRDDAFMGDSSSPGLLSSRTNLTCVHCRSLVTLPRTQSSFSFSWSIPKQAF